jgi:16S rRNA (uracil1498-N3)-methyltransferase
VSIPLIVGQTIDLNPEESHYLKTVLRLKKATKIIIFNGLGGEYSSTLLAVTRKSVRVRIDEKIERSVESCLTISIGMGISRSHRMDMTVQKSVELGVNSITPLMTQRGNVVIRKDKLEQKHQHWQKIAQHAAEQSGRTIVPKINPIMRFSAWLENSLNTELKIFLDPFAQTPLTQLRYQQTDILLLTGAEGGFCHQEKQLAITHQFTPIRLGPRILRTETASLAALSAIQLLWGDFT